MSATSRALSSLTDRAARSRLSNSMEVILPWCCVLATPGRFSDGVLAVAILVASVVLVRGADRAR